MKITRYLLKVALYGTRRERYLWGENVATTLCSDAGGFMRLKGSPQTYVQEQREIRTCVHGDDFWSSACHEHVTVRKGGPCPVVGSSR